jgi:voltage-gated potassium channel Kch
MFRELFKTLKAMWQEPAGRGLIMGFLAIVGTGTVFYHFVEEWSWVDSLYFTVVMLTTVGFGDFYPTTEFSRIFTVLFILTGVAFILGFLSFIMSRTVQRRAEEKLKVEILPGAPGYVAPLAVKPIDESTPDETIG